MFGQAKHPMRSAVAVVAAVLALIPACSSTSGSPRDLAVAGLDVKLLSAGDVLFPDFRGKEAGPLSDVEKPADAFSTSLTVTSSQVLGWKSTCGAVPIESPPLAPGNYLVVFTASNLSKGTGHDDYLLIGLPPGANDANGSLRYFVLNGLGAKRSFALSSPGVVRAWFLDSDDDGNTGTGTATITPGVHGLTVDGAVNVIAWLDGCKSAPAVTEIPAGAHRLTLTASTFSSAPGLADPHVVLRLPLEGDESTKYLSLNGIGDSKVITFPAFGIARAWFVAEAAGTQSGQATVTVTAP